MNNKAELDGFMIVFYIVLGLPILILLLICPSVALWAGVIIGIISIAYEHWR